MVDPTYARLSDILFWTALVVYAVAMVASFAGLAYKSKRFAFAGVVILWAGTLANLGWAITRGLSVGRVPWGNMFEYSGMVGLGIALGYLVWFEARLKLRQLAGFAAAAALLWLGSASLLYVPAQQLQPALNSQWLRVHVIAAITGSTLFGLSFIFTVLYLLKDRAERRAPQPAPEEPQLYAGSTVGAAYMGPPGDEGMPADHVQADAGGSAVAVQTQGFWARMPSAETFDKLAYRTIAFAFPIWTFAVIAGAMWAHRAWSRYWAWDPKETWAFVTWVIYAGYLHARATAGWKGRRSAIISVVGFAAVLFTYFAVNLWIEGLHSYKNG